MTGDHREVEATLARYARLTREAMQPFLAGGEPSAYLYDLVRDYPARPGKGIRPALLLATCQAFGGSLRDATAPAAALELLHNAFLVHDDVEDASAARRGRPTLHELHGVPLSVNAGDALAALALRPLRDRRALGSRLTERVLDEFLTTVRHTTEGQAMELGWRRDDVVDLGPADYLTMTAKKTSWYTTVAPLRIGALIGSRGEVPLNALTRFGFHLGLAFQVRDDLLNLDGGNGRHGKDPLGDLREGKRTLMLVHVLAAADARDRAWLRDYLATPDAARREVDAERVLELMRRHGSLALAGEYGRGIADGAQAAFDDAFAGVAPSEHLAFVRGLVPYMLERPL